MTQPDYGSEKSEMKRLVDEIPELGSLMEGLNAYFVHVYTADMPIWDNEEETKRLLDAIRSGIDSSAQISSIPYSTKTQYLIYYGPYASKLEAARMAKKVKDAGYSFYIKIAESSPSTPSFMYLEGLTGACNLNRKPLIFLASNHFLFEFKHEVDFDDNEIEFSGFFTTNIYKNFVKKEHPRTLKNIDIKVFFLDINRSRLIHSDGFSLKYEDGEEPSIFDKIPFKVRFPFNLEYMNVSFQYSAELLPIEINPKDSDAYNNRGLAYSNKDNYDQAIADYSKAIEINPKYAIAYSNRGVAYFFIKKYEEAWDDVHKAQNLGENVHPEFLNYLRQASGRQE